jgi:transcription elongation factor Elf1/predicted RNA methylase
MIEERKLTKEDIDSVRDIEGFPIANDEDIIALSRPPYYTACPNPFIEDFIHEYGTPYDEATDDYHREPFAADVSEGKNDPIYMAHSYHTKVPYKAIMRYILHYTKPGEIVLDGFCGSGMTGVAAQMCGTADAETKAQITNTMKDVEWGRRHAILNDLSPIASLLAKNYNTVYNASEFKNTANAIIEKSEKEYGWMYETHHVQGGTQVLGINGKPIVGTINCTVWSDVFVCPNCSKEIVFWDAALDTEEKTMRDTFTCDSCGAHLKKSDCTRAKVNLYDALLDKQIQVSKQTPVMIVYTVGNKRYSKSPDENDLDILRKIDEMSYTSWCPTDELPDGFNTEQPKQSHGLFNVHQFYTKRNLLLVSSLRECLFIDRLSFEYTALLSRATKQLRLLVSNYFNGAGGWVGTGLSGTLYIPSISIEVNALETFKNKIKRAIDINYSESGTTIVSCSSTTSLQTVMNNSVDYIFTDPPFGANINYSELSFIWESWLKIKTNNKCEAIMNNVQHKGLLEYQGLMEKCFCEYYRVLKPGRWMTIEFHNSQNAVWNAISEALLRAGFIVADVRTLDKKQGSFKQVTTTTAVKQDLVISVYKPKESFVHQFTERAGDPEMAWEFVRQHLQNVPIAPDSTGEIEVVAERQDYLLFDRMVAFHVMNGIPVPMDANTFYAGLRERFIQRDCMFFLADQVNEYDERRQKMELQDQQLSLIVFDEKSAIIWLNIQLTKDRQSYSDIQPKYLQELYQAKFEQMPELLDMLKENFLQDDNGKWYVPNLSDKADLGKLRRKRLLKDFYDIYAKGTGRIKNARTEAIRVGFDECWKERNYSLIVKVGDRLPETVLQEDPALLMYYDNAANRM